MGAREKQRVGSLSKLQREKIEVVASQRVGSHMYDNVKNVNITYHIKKKRFLPCMGFLRKYLSLCISYV